MNDTYVMDYSCAVLESLDLPSISSLIVSLRIGEKCCASTSSLMLQSFPRLGELVIGEESFGKKSEKSITFSCVDCPELVSIIIGNKAMQFFSRMIIMGENECVK